MPSYIRILIADDHPPFSDGLRRLLEVEPDIKVVGQASNVADAVNRVLELKPDILLLDLKMPPQPRAAVSPRGGLDVLASLKASGQLFKAILFAAEMDTQEIVAAVELGVYGVLLKSAATELLIESIRAVMSGTFWAMIKAIPTFNPFLTNMREELNKRKFGLTPRQLQVASAVVRHRMANKDIAQFFKIAEDTVRHHISEVFDKLGVSTRLELYDFAREHKLPLKDLF